jgi:hypothetical protein
LLLLVLLPILLLQQGTSQQIGPTHPQCLQLLLQLHRFRTPMRSLKHSLCQSRCPLVLWWLQPAAAAAHWLLAGCLLLLLPLLVLVCHLLSSCPSSACR